jgi:capsular exopolysaccharide synthesis family protein
MSNKMLDEISKNLFKYSNGDPYVDKILAEYSKSTLEIVKDDIELFALEERSKVYNDELDKLPLIERQVTDLERNVTVLQQVGLSLRSMLEEVKLTEAAVSGNVTVIDYAEIPLNPISPNKLLIMAVAMLLGIALGFLMCIIANLRDNSLNSREDVRKAIGDNIPLLGWIPLIMPEKKSEKNADNFSNYSSIPVYKNPSSQIAEKYMSITSNLIYGTTLSKNQVMSITSCGMSSGKSTAISNIAMCLAQMGSRVIIVDGDFRRSTILSTFGYSRTPKGCVEVVLGKKKLEEVIFQPIPGVENLHVLPVGHKPQVPSSILAHPRFSEMIDILRVHYDYILIDAPPLTYASEVLFLCKMSDTTLINVRAGITPKEALKELLVDLDPVKAKISGAILNGFVPSKNDHGGSVSGKYGYGYGYGASSNDDNDRNSKLVSQTKAKRLEIKLFKNNIKDRDVNDSFFQKKKRYPSVVPNLNFGNVTEQFKSATFNNSSIYNNFDALEAKKILQKTEKEVDGLKENLDKSSKKDLEKKVATIFEKGETYSSIIDNLKKDSESSGKKK